MEPKEPASALCLRENDNLVVITLIGFLSLSGLNAGNIAQEKKQMTDTIKILIVEDEALIALHLKYLLRSAGYTITGVAVSGEQAIQCADEDPPDLAVLDVKLVGEMNGIEVAEHLYTHYGTQVIYLSAYTPEQLRTQVNPERPFRYLSKSFHNKDLIRAIEEALGE